MNSLTRWFLEKAAFSIKEVHHDDDDIRPPTSTAPTDSPVPVSGIPEDKDIPSSTHKTGLSFQDGDTATTSSAEVNSHVDQATQRAGPTMPGAFEPESWSFSKLDQ